MHQLTGRPELQVVDPDQVCDATTVLSNTAELEQSATVLDSLGCARRLSLLLALHHVGDLCVSDLAVVTGMSDSAVSHALRLLRAHGIVAAHREGRFIRYQITDGLTARLLDVISERVVGDVQLHVHGNTHGSAVASG